MSEWEAIIVNDPDDDYNLVIELELDDDCVGVIRKRSGKLEVVFLTSMDNIAIPGDWLAEILNRAAVELT
ncbi:hypothetical protein ACERII_10275 [Evansella sp. AB-rgal1]|uniref:hypothetical protein n=1 Tax=Evansella sp. AB-rgal1 TaxID=3242696 RepID=UPI00359D7AB0